VRDITCIATDEGWLCLTVLMDLCSRSIIGWSLSGRMTTQLTCDTLRMVVFRRDRPENIIVASDRGSQ
jgi:transposase InsO family protein